MSAIRYGVMRSGTLSRVDYPHQSDCVCNECGWTSRWRYGEGSFTAWWLSCRAHECGEEAPDLSKLTPGELVDINKKVRP